MEEHSKLKRLLGFILLLLGPRKYNREELQERFIISKSTFHRYIKILKDCGILVVQNQGFYQIIKIEPEFKELSELLHFSEEEAQILNSALLSIDDNNQLKTNLIRKLYAIYNFDRIPETISRPERAKNIQALIQAIKHKQQIKLIDYQSAHSQHTETRHVEAFDFTINYQMTWAYDIKNKCSKQFKVSRIKEVRILKRPWKHEAKHQKQANDAFRMTGNLRVECLLELSLRAGNLLIEEYPLSEPKLQLLKNETYLYKDIIHDYQGIGRFCLGLLNEVNIIEPKGLRDYIHQCLKKYKANNLSVIN